MAGCPFTNFGPCAEGRCAFFVVHPQEMTADVCLIRANYFLSLIGRIHRESASLFPDCLPGDHFLQSLTGNWVDSLVSCLHRLRVLLDQPQTDAALRKLAREWQDQILLALKEFASG